jgi:hypothetical protein
MFRFSLHFNFKNSLPITKFTSIFEDVQLAKTLRIASKRYKELHLELNLVPNGC